MLGVHGLDILDAPVATQVGNGTIQVVNVNAICTTMIEDHLSVLPATTPATPARAQVQVVAHPVPIHGEEQVLQEAAHAGQVTMKQEVDHVELAITPAIHVQIIKVIAVKPVQQVKIDIYQVVGAIAN